jgi:hypothetical protein
MTYRESQDFVALQRAPRSVAGRHRTLLGITIETWLRDTE